MTLDEKALEPVAYVSEAILKSLEHGGRGAYRTQISNTPFSAFTVPLFRVSALSPSVGREAFDGMLAALTASAEFDAIIDRIEARCMATDGPVTPTLAEMREDELASLWRSVQGIRAAIAKAEAAPTLEGWQDISTAPTDWTHFLARDETCGHMFRAAISPEGTLHAFCGQPVVQPPEATHWLSFDALPDLPVPPLQETGE